MVVSSVVTLVDRLPLAVLRDEILAVVSVVVVEKLALTDVNEPLIFDAVKLLISVAFVPNEPLILTANCAEPLTTSLSFILPRILSEPVNWCMSSAESPKMVEPLAC